jgi:hypothetical protein
MRLPTDEVRHAGRDRLLGQKIMRPARGGASDQHDEAYPEKGRAILLEHALGARRPQQVDEGADIAEHRDLDQRDDEADCHQAGEEGPDLAAEAPVEAQEVRRRHALVMGPERVDPGFEEAEHGLFPMDVTAHTVETVLAKAPASCRGP